MNRPVRTCVVCGEKREKTFLLRIVQLDSCFQIDEKRVLPGRGRYVCIDKMCGILTGDDKSLKKALRTNDVRQLQEQLRKSKDVKE